MSAEHSAETNVTASSSEEAARDHLVRASTVVSKRGPMGLLDEDEQRVAMGAYDRSRYEEYQRQVDLEMQRRAVEGGYDSDMDRDEAAHMLVRDPEQEAWRHQDEWMDEYRRRLGPEVKLEQDLAMRRAEEEAARNRHFKASPVPSAVLEPRYERMLMEKEASTSMMEKPFSFYYRDQERQAQREALARAAKDPNRFQTNFRARDPPTHTKEERLKHMLIHMEAKREATRRRVEEARRLARERAEEEAQRRREAANRAYQERLRSVDPMVHHGPHPSRPAGLVPDFNSLHRNHEVQMARARANIRKRVTVPQAQKALERRQKIILDMQVRRTPLPAYLVEYMARSPGNHSTNVRKSSTAVAAQDGAFQTREEKEAVARKASEKLRAEALRRADRLLAAAAARKQQEAAVAGEYGLASDVGATAAGGGADQSSSGRGAAMRRRTAVTGRTDNPEVYVEARHMQIERRVRMVVEDALLDQGIEAYRYVEGVGDSKKDQKGKAEAE
ncbi:hypothetical protein GPECTOR_19g335 [Gonium pectorale]|uniref:Uncharacterized protein n=1 Tax=Gonium pectorale TaxID=33097 RepID=A0A150GJE0_GONPE|nr:hypothetical protein GPECTOR_19g335 [Gonium pectorale]|eukprot:KXZ49884.1 hypothetical protein GPECTOR_19g335 [Gonium pectorale]